MTNDLTAREEEIVRQLAAGKSQQETARTLYLAMSTIKFHLESARSKAGVTTTCALVAWWFREIEVPSAYRRGVRDGAAAAARREAA